MIDPSNKPTSAGPKGRTRGGNDQKSLRSQILDCIGQAVAVVDLKDRIIFWSRFSEVLFGWQEEEVLGRNLLELVVPDVARRQVREVMAQLREGKAWVGEMVVLKRDGAEFCSLMANTPLHDSDGRVIGRIAAITDISDRKDAEEKLRDNQTQLRALTDRLVTVREAEATRIAREIHDQMGQALTALKMDVAALDLDLRGRGACDEDGKLRARIKSMSAAIESTLETALKLCTELRPAVLDKLGLVAAIEWAARDFEARNGIFCNLDLPAETISIETKRATAMFRIFQEILTNVIRHAEASEVTIQLGARQDALRLEVTDNGRGIGPNKGEAELGLGIIGMRERALGVGGRIEFREASRRGTTVIVEVPKE